MEKHILSKSSFIRGLQCSKSLFLYKNFYKQRDKTSPEQQAIFSRGTNVGVMARKLFPGGIDASPSSPFKYVESVELTQKLIRGGVEIIYEAAFMFERTLIAIDILVKRNNTWYAYEVKSSTKISPTYLSDASLQYYIITNSGIELSDISIININTNYVKQGELDYYKLFHVTSVKSEAVNNTVFIKENVQKLLAVAGNSEQPNVQIGEHCFRPYACDFIGTCWKDVPADSVLHLSGVPKEKLFQLYNSGVKTINDIPDDHEANRSFKLQVESLTSNKAIIDKPGIKKFLETINYPLFFMDFETIMPAIPLYNNTHPYQHIPFQYSIHFKETKSSTLVHYEFLAEAGSDPRRQFIEQLIKHTSRPGDILTYYSTFERSVLNNLKRDLPEYTNDIDYILYRIKDLITPFENKLYYHPLMKGSYSIKNVLPALVSDLNYNTLNIGSGSIAMAAFEHLQTEVDIFKIAETRDALKAYCEMDTLAMVKILEVLENSVSE
jgi:predicted RecB family nuclease